MADHAAEMPSQPEQKKPGVVERVKNRLGEFWQRIGPESVIKDRMVTYQAVHEALGPGKAREVNKLLKPVVQVGAAFNGVAATVGEMTLGVITGLLVRRLTKIIPTNTALLGSLVGGRIGGGIGIIGGEAVRTSLSAGAGVGVAELGVTHKAQGVFEERIVRPLSIRVAETVGRITRGWDAPPMTLSPATE